MTDIDTISPPADKSLANRIANWFRNPVTVKELRSRMRGRRAFVILTLYLLALTAIITLIYLTYSAGVNAPGSVSARSAGKGVFVGVVAIQVFLVVFIGPAFTAAAISGERERQTYDLLRTTLLSAESFVLGKLLSALGYVFLLVMVSIPLQSIAFLLGGLSLTELLVAQLLILVAAITYAIYGLWCSATMPTTLASTVATFAGTLFVTIGLPFILLIGLSISSFGLFSSTVPTVVQSIIIYGGLLLASANLPATMIISEVILLEENSLFLINMSTTAGPLWLISPWILFVIIHIIVAIVLFFATVRRVRRVSDI